MGLTREQDRERIRRRRETMTDQEREEERRKARERMRRLARARGVPERKRRVRRPQGQPQTPVVRDRDPVPSEIRTAYSRAHPNSIIKRKYPTWQALRREKAGQGWREKGV